MKFCDTLIGDPHQTVTEWPYITRGVSSWVAGEVGVYTLSFCLLDVSSIVKFSYQRTECVCGDCVHTTAVDILLLAPVTASVGAGVGDLCMSDKLIILGQPWAHVTSTSMTCSSHEQSLLDFWLDFDEFNLPQLLPLILSSLCRTADFWGGY